MFDELVSKKLIEVIWVLASIGIVLAGLVTMISAEGFWGFVAALILTAIGLLYVRVICEAMIVVFKMDEKLKRSNHIQEEMLRHLTILSSRSMSQAAQHATPVTVPVTRESSAKITTASGIEAGAPTGTTRPTISHEGYHDQMSAVRDQLQQQVRENRKGSKSKLGDWPG